MEWIHESTVKMLLFYYLFIRLGLAENELKKKVDLSLILIG